MGHVLSFDEVLYRQRFLSCCGFYNHLLDGDWGRHTDEAEQKFAARCQAIAAAEGTFDPRTERCIASLQADAQQAARRSLKAIRATGVDARIISGTRTYPEQSALYAQGRSKPGRIVTNAKAGSSWHNFGLAWDIGIFKNGAYVANDDGPYRAVAPAAKVPGIEWGGDWTTFKDYPHYQFGTNGQGVSSGRARFESGGR